MKILLIDDEQALLEVFIQTLQTAKLDVITSQNGKDGVEKAKSQKPDVILLDQILPDMNGNQALQMLKTDPITQHIPVAILSNYNQDDMMQQAINLGATDYILKYQIAPQDLIAKVQNMLPKETTQSDQTQLTDLLPPAISPVPPAPLETEQLISVID